MKNGRYEAAVAQFVPASPKDWSEGDIFILSEASNIDRLIEQIVKDSRSLARRFEVYADEVENRGRGWDPSGYSSLRDITTNTAKLEDARDRLVTFIRTLKGKDAAKAFVKEIGS